MAPVTKKIEMTGAMLMEMDTIMQVVKGRYGSFCLQTCVRVADKTVIY